MKALLELRRHHLVSIGIIDRELAKGGKQGRLRDPSDFKGGVNLSESGKKKLKRLIETVGCDLAASEMCITSPAARRWANYGSAETCPNDK